MGNKNDHCTFVIADAKKHEPPVVRLRLQQDCDDVDVVDAVSGKGIAFFTNGKLWLYAGCDIIPGLATDKNGRIEIGNA